MTGDDFIDFARKAIVMHRGSPAAMRSVVSRAYYGVFHLARTMLEHLGFHSIQDENSHRFVLIQFANAGEDLATDIAALLGELHERRKRADYDLDNPRYETELFAADSIARADRANRLLDVSRSEPAHTRIRDGIISYRAKVSPPSHN
jgi:uncharacterized protein (UPF0332 family)